MKPIPRILPAAALALASAVAISGCEKRSESGARTPSTASGKRLSQPTEMLFDEEAERALSEDRRNLLAALRSETITPVTMVVDGKSTAVMSLILKVPTSGMDVKERALKFLDTYRKLIDDRVSVDEYVPADEKRCGDAVMMLDRVVWGQRVAGSRITLHFDDDGNVIAVTNGVAPVPSNPVSIHPVQCPGAIDLVHLLPPEIKLGSERRVKVLVPAWDGSGLQEAELASWPDASRNGGYAAALVLGNVAITGKLTAAGEGAVVTPSGPVQPKFRSHPLTSLPQFISYRDVGGARVGVLAAERNPLETVYRFLEEHPMLLRTGAPRLSALASHDIEMGGGSRGGWAGHSAQPRFRVRRRT